MPSSAKTLYLVISDASPKYFLKKFMNKNFSINLYVFVKDMFVFIKDKKYNI